jgi:flagellar basal-body rod protein FlgC
MVQASNTELAREMTNLMSNENAFAANAAVIRTRDEMIGGLINELA